LRNLSEVFQRPVGSLLETSLQTHFLFLPIFTSTFSISAFSSSLGPVPMIPSTKNKFSKNKFAAAQRTPLADAHLSAAPENAPEKSPENAPKNGRLNEAENEPAVKRTTLQKVMYRPLVWIAVSLHVALLVVPFGDRPSTETIEAETADPDTSIPVDILNLSEIATSTPEPPPPASPPPPSSAAPPPASSAAPQASTPPPQQPNPADPSPTDTALAPTDTSSQNSNQPTQAYDPTADQQVFIANLAGFGDADTTGKTGLPPVSLFRKGNGQFFVSPDGTAANGASDARWMNQKPEEILNTLTSTYSGALTFTQVENYGDELLYQAVTATGETAMYISLVDMKASTVLVIWPQNPSAL